MIDFTVFKVQHLISLVVLIGSDARAILRNRHTYEMHAKTLNTRREKKKNPQSNSGHSLLAVCATWNGMFFVVFLYFCSVLVGSNAIVIMDKFFFVYGSSTYQNHQFACTLRNCCGPQMQFYLPLAIRFRLPGHCVAVNVSVSVRLCTFHSLLNIDRFAENY